MTDPQLLKSLGLYGFAFILLLILVGLFFVLKWLHRAIKSEKYKALNKAKDALQDKLFYSSFLRYMIQSYLKLTFTVFGSLMVATAVVEQKGQLELLTEPFSVKLTEAITLVGILLVVLFLVVYPICTMIGLIKYQERLEEPEVKK